MASEQVIVELDEYEVVIEESLSVEVAEETTVAVIEETGVEILEVSEPGPAGGSGLVEFEQVFSSPAMSWTVNHNLGRHPLVTTLDNGGAEIKGKVLHTSINQFIVFWSLLTAGRVRCV